MRGFGEKTKREELFKSTIVRLFSLQLSFLNSRLFSDISDNQCGRMRSYQLRVAKEKGVKITLSPTWN
jgi:hypothetical protein